MSDLQIIRQQHVSFGATGETARGDEVFIKVLVSFQDRLMQLKNARLSVFMAYALQESKIILGASGPLSLRAAEKIVPYSRPSIIDALDYLVEFNFLTELEERGSDGEKLYRVCSYAWFGTSHSGAPAFHPGDAADVPADPQSIQSNEGGQNSLPPPNKRATSASVRKSEHATGRGSKNSLLGLKDFSPIYDDINLSDSDSSKHHHICDSARKIFSKCGFAGPNLLWLAEHVEDEIAELWCAWIAAVKGDAALLKKYHSPHGYAWKVLRADPTAKPPEASNVASRTLLSDKWFVHGTREHAEYCRAHPGKFTCGCENDL